MRRLLISILALLVPLLLSLEVVSEDDEANRKLQDECILIAAQCGTRVLSIQDKIERLEEEIAKGTAVYSPEELRMLKQKLQEANKILDFLGPPQ